MSDPPGRVETIWIKRVRRGPMDRVDSVRALAGNGLEGNANQGGRRQVTLLSADAWESVCRELEAEVDPALRRANVLLRGIDLEGSRDRVLRIGDCRVRIHGETRPCRLMAESHPGLQEALDPDWRGGVYGEILDDAEIRVGDPASWEADP